jgi:hypothetical protein
MISDPSKLRNGPPISAVLSGHYEVRRKMAQRIEELEKRVIELQKELKRLKESANGSCVALCDNDGSGS